MTNALAVLIARKQYRQRSSRVDSSFSTTVIKHNKKVSVGELMERQSQ